MTNGRWRRRSTCQRHLCWLLPASLATLLAVAVCLVPVASAGQSRQRSDLAWALAIASSGISIGGGAWTWSFPTPLGADLSDIHFTAPATGFACGSFAEVLRTADGGATWTAVPVAGADAGACLSSLSFRDGMNGWVCGTVEDAVEDMNDAEPSAAFVAATADGGNSWRVIGAWSRMRLTSVALIDGTHGWATGSRWSAEDDRWIPAVMHTADGGATWQAQAAVTRGATSMGSLVALSTKTACALADAGSQRSAIFRTTDGGATWSVVLRTPEDSRLASIAFRDDRDGWCVGSYGTVYRTVDSGVTWQRLRGGQWDFDYDFSIVTCAADDGIWASGSAIEVKEGSYRVRIMHSSDGVSWRTVNTPAGNWDPNALEISAAGAWAAGSGGRMLRSPDSGRSWKSTAPAQQPVAFHASGAERAWLTGGAGFLRKTADGGRHWKQCRLPAGFRHVDFVALATSGRHVWVIGNDGELIRSSDGGLHWRGKLLLGPHPPPRRGLPDMPRLSFADLQFVDAVHGWIASGSLLLRTTNGGRTWRRLAMPRAFVVEDFEFADARRGHAINSEGAVLTTPDGGLHWERHKLPITTSLGRIVVQDRRRAWIVQNWECPAFFTVDGGTTWQTSSAGFGQLDFVTPLLAFAVAHGFLLKSVDGGLSWQDVAVLPACMQNAVPVFTDSERGWLYGEGEIGTLVGGAGLLRTVSGGRSVDGTLGH